MGKKTGLTDAQLHKAKILRSELTKVRCWISGFTEGRRPSGNTLNLGIPGEDSLRQVIQFLDELGASHD